MNAKKQAQKSAASRREQLRAQQAADAKARQRKMRILYVLCGVVAFAVIAVVGVVVYNTEKDKRERAAREAASQVRPPNALEDGSGVVANPGKFKPGVPVLTIYQDYQCPACKQAEDYFGATIKKLADEGKIELHYRTLTFLDINLQNDSSTRAAMAAACSDVVGKLEEYHAVVYKNQPKQEGDGYTDQQLRETFATEAGITGADLTKFQTCVDDKQTSKWVRESNLAAQKTFQGSTPQYDINGKNPASTVDPNKKWWQVLEPTEQAWLAAFEQYK